MNKIKKPLIALLTNNDDDVYCFRKELIDGILNAGYEMLISCPYGDKFELMKDYKYIYDDPTIDRRGTNVIADFKLLLHYRKLLKNTSLRLYLHIQQSRVFTAVLLLNFSVFPILTM